MQTTINDILKIVGEKEVEIHALRAALAAETKRAVEAEAALVKAEAGAHAGPAGHERLKVVEQH